MTPRPYRDEPFPPLAGEPADLCVRLQADLDVRADAAILRVYGEADAYTLARWRRMLDIALAAAGDCGRLVVDLSGTQFIGCRCILDLAERAQHGLARGIQIAVFDPIPNAVERVVTLAGLHAWLPVHTTLVEAMTTRRPRVAAPARAVVPVPGAR
ncbi:STAS domain-containing protein [Nocardia asteroides]|uniref:STAS domain-containing protein n=1 Tax=Nocardia asteroides TaxID=1824 RepID=UPI0037AD0768